MALKGLTLNPTAGCRELPTLWLSFAKQTNKSLSNNSQASFLAAKTWILQEAGLPKIPNCYTVAEQLKTVSWLAKSLTSSFTHSFIHWFICSFIYQLITKDLLPHFSSGYGYQDPPSPQEVDSIPRAAPAERSAWLLSEKKKWEHGGIP